MSSFFKKALVLSFSVVLSIFSIGFGNGTTTSKDYKQYKNVILLIGDGMGFNTIGATKALRDISLAMETMPVQGRSDTNSFMLPSTDSAAGGTALSCGIRVWSGTVAVFPSLMFQNNDVLVPLSLTELAKNNGKAAGVVTTDKIDGATPAAFSSHTDSRKNSEEIANDQLESGLDLLWGCDSEPMTRGRCNEKGITYIKTIEEMQKLGKGSRSIGEFNINSMADCIDDGVTPSIEQMTTKAIDILNENENGFFLMVEGARIDKNSHKNNFVGATLHLAEFDKAVKAALDFAEKDGNTLVVVTADHETGGIIHNKKTGEYFYTTTEHGMVDVPLFVSATDAGFKDGKEVENRQISVQIARVMGFGEDQFPAVKGDK